MSRYIDADLVEKFVKREDHGTPDERWRPEREFCAIIDSIPSSNVQEVVRCKECKYFELNHVDVYNGIPLITAHEICTKWGEGCKTDSNGFCFLGERKAAE